MPANTTYLTDQQLAQIAYKTFDYYINKGKRPHPQNIQNRPLLKLIGKKIAKTKRPFINNEVKYNVETVSDRQFQEKYGREQIDFAEGYFGDTLTFNGTQVLLTLEVVHDALRDMGYEVGSWQNWKVPPQVSEAAKLEIAEYLGHEFERLDDDYMRLMDSMLHGAGTGTPAFPGLAAFFPTTNTTGSIGGKSRAANVWVRHNATTGLTATAGGTLQTNLDNLVRECNRYAASGAVDCYIVGSGVLDAVKTYAKNNNIQLNTNLAGVSGVDLSMPDSAIKWDGIPMIWDPTIDATNSKLGYALNCGSLELAYATDKEFGRPSDEYNLMVSRFVLRGRYAMVCKQPNANGVFTVA